MCRYECLSMTSTICQTFRPKIFVIVSGLITFYVVSYNNGCFFFWHFQDESILIWFSGKEEKHLKLSYVSRIMPGQRTVSF